MRPPLTGAGHIPIFAHKDPDCPFPLEQFNVVLRTVSLIMFQKYVLCIIDGYNNPDRVYQDMATLSNSQSCYSYFFICIRHAQIIVQSSV